MSCCNHRCNPPSSASSSLKFENGNDDSSDCHPSKRPRAQGRDNEKGEPNRELIKELLGWEIASDSQVHTDLNAIAKAAQDPNVSLAYPRLVQLCDSFPHRLGGSEALEQAIDWVESHMKKEGTDKVNGHENGHGHGNGNGSHDGRWFDRVYTEEVMVPHWVRGKESCALVSPSNIAKKIEILGIGSSVGTPKDGITGELVVVRSFKELSERGDVAGKIVLFNAKFTNYGDTVPYRAKGPDAASKAGAVACLVRSVTPYSLYTPHTGTLRYGSDCAHIPAACITVEDAELLQRVHDRGDKPVVCLHMEAQNLPEAKSRNIIAEIRGSEKPEEVIIFGGHIDSWDVGQGAHDDAQGVVVAWEILRLFKLLHIKPRRTIRAVVWTNEENGKRGALAYRDYRKDEVSKHVAAIETDVGVHRAVGFGVSGTDLARRQVRALCSLLGDLGATFVDDDGAGVDIEPLIELGVPGMLLRLGDEWWTSEYFHIHHTNADTVDKVDPADLMQNVAVIASMVYLLDACPTTLHKDPSYKPKLH